LDSDVIVLQPIEELTTRIHITGCHDDPSSVRGIPDTKYPWLGDPDSATGMELPAALIN
jgi:hypothetical protein